LKKLERSAIILKIRLCDIFARDFFRPEQIAVTVLGPLNGFTSTALVYPAKGLVC
jgi:hypothetical protein